MKYKVKIDGKTQELTASEYSKKFPEKRRITNSKEVKMRTNKKQQIRHHISKRFHDKEEENKVACQAKKRGRPTRRTLSVRRTASVQMLQELFLKIFISEGYAGLPPKIEEEDPEDSSSEWEDLVITKYRTKPLDYESERLLALNDESR